MPADGDVLTIDFPLLLDTTTVELGGMKIVGDGRLVFDPESSLAKLITDYVLIEDGGSLEIGSEECPYEGDAEILLTGIRTDDNDIGDWGQKFIGVGYEGSLEIHGKPKLSWTRLAETLTKSERAYDSFSDLNSDYPISRKYELF